MSEDIKNLCLGTNKFINLLCYPQVRVEGAMGTIHANNPDYLGSAYFDVVNLRSSGEYKVSQEQNIAIMSVLGLLQESKAKQY